MIETDLQKRIFKARNQIQIQSQINTKREKERERERERSNTKSFILTSLPLRLRPIVGKPPSFTNFSKL